MFFTLSRNLTREFEQTAYTNVKNKNCKNVKKGKLVKKNGNSLSSKSASSSSEFESVDCDAPMSTDNSEFENLGPLTSTDEYRNLGPWSSTDTSESQNFRTQPSTDGYQFGYLSPQAPTSLIESENLKPPTTTEQLLQIVESLSNLQVI